jgi:hypothetical protein
MLINSLITNLGLALITETEVKRNKIKVKPVLIAAHINRGIQSGG